MIKHIVIFGTLACLSGTAAPAIAGDTSLLDNGDTATINTTKTEQAREQARGVLKARQTANLAAAMSARILKAPYKPGQHFKRGALLIRFDCERLQAEKSAMVAAKSTAQLKHTNISELLVAGAAGELEVTLAAADVTRATAEISVINAKLKACSIRAPYNGIVQEKHISVYDTPAVNTPLLSIIRDGKPEIKLIAPSTWMAWIKPGIEFEFTVDETGKTYPAIVLRTGASIDPVSQTIELTAKFSKAAQGAMAGMSGIANFPAQSATKTSGL